MRLLHVLRWACWFEGLSSLMLFAVAMPLKYAAGLPKPTMVVGAVHGGLFLLVMGLWVIALASGCLRPKLALWVWVGALVPGVAFFVDGKLKAAQAAAEPTGE